MKITGYKLKESIKAFERLREDHKLVVTAVPTGKAEDTLEIAEKFNLNFKANQILLSCIGDLRKIQLEYNSKVKVSDNQTLLDVIQDTSRMSALTALLDVALKQVTAHEAYIEVNKQTKLTRDALYPNGGRSPCYPEPVLAKETLQKAVRKFRMDETKLKNLVGYGNSVELEMAVDARLFDEDRWTNFNAVEEITNITGVYEMLNGNVITPHGLVVNPTEMSRFIQDLPDHPGIVRPPVVAQSYVLDSVGRKVEIDSSEKKAELIS